MNTPVENFGPVPCPTCKQTGTHPCIRGRWPSAIWERGELFLAGHDSRRTANRATPEGTYDRLEIIVALEGGL